MKIKSIVATVSLVAMLAITQQSMAQSNDSTQNNKIENKEKTKTLSEAQLTELTSAMETIQSILKEHESAAAEQAIATQNTEKKSYKFGATKMDRGIKHKTFVPKGQLIIGGTIGYNQFKASDYEFLMIKDIGANIRTTGAKVSAAWAFTDDVAAGIMFDYSRIQADRKSVV